MFDYNRIIKFIGGEWFLELIFEYEEILITLNNLIDETANEIANELIYEKAVEL